MPQNTTSLRPTFTNKIFDKLKRGESINLIGGKGTGRTRLLHDLKRKADAEGIITVILDIKTCRYSYESFQDQINEQLSQLLPESSGNFDASNDNTLPITVNGEKAIVEVNLSIMLLRRLPEGKRIFLLLDNFNDILDRRDQRFPKTFFDDLNALKNKSNISLCCVTEESHLQSQIYCEDEKGEFHQGTSWLELNIIDIPRMGLHEIRDELNAKMGNNNTWKDEFQQEYFVDQIHSTIPQSKYMKLVVNNFELEGEAENAEHRWGRIKNGYKKNHVKKAASFWSWDVWLERGKKLSEIWKNFKSK